MSTWDSLFALVNRADLSGRRQGAARDAFEAWCLSAEDGVVEALATTVAARRAELSARTDVHVRVTQSSQPLVWSQDGARWRVLELGLGSSRVFLYTTRVPGLSPGLHLGVLKGATSSTRHPVLATLPGGLVVRDEGQGWKILDPRHPSSAEPRPHLTVDALVLRAFEVLLGCVGVERAPARLLEGAPHSAT